MDPQRSSRWLRHLAPHGLWAAPAIAVLLYAGIVARLVAPFGGDVSSLICAGDRYRPPQEIRDHVLVAKRSDGYDGQFFLFAACDPWITRGYSRYMDIPAYRYQRILYPWLTALLSAGRVAWMPWAMVVVNLLSIAGGVFAAAVFCRREGLAPWWGLLYATLSGLLLATARDLSEPLATALLTAAMAAYAARRTGWAAAGLALACLARETSAVMAPVLCFDALVRRRDRRSAAALAASLGPFAAWQAYVALRFGMPSWRGGQQNLGRPLAALWDHAADVWAGLPAHSLTERLFLGLFVATACVAAGLALREVLRRRDEVSFGLLGFSAMPFVMSPKVWVEPWSYARVLVPGAVFLLLAFARSRDRIYLLPLAAHAALFVLALRWLRVLAAG